MNHIINVFLMSISVFCTMHLQAQTGESKQPATIRPRINHLAMQVENLQRSTVFYRDIVGLDTIPEPFHDGKHTWFSIGGGAHLHLIEHASKPVIPLKHTHLCFSVPSVEAFVKGLKQHNVAWEDWAGTAGAITKRVDGVHQIYFRDPDGYWLEVNDDKSER